MPSVAGEAKPAPGAATQPTEPADTAAAGPGKVRIVTDVLDIDLNLTGGEVIRADLSKYPRHKDDPGTPVRLFNTDSKDTQFLFQSGLTSGEEGRNEPNHKAPFTSAAPEYRLAAGRGHARSAAQLVGWRRFVGHQDFCIPPRRLQGRPAI